MASNIDFVDYVVDQIAGVGEQRQDSKVDSCELVKTNYGGHNACDYGGHPAPAGRALPNLLMRSKC
jgi:hypothetical protein